MIIIFGVGVDGTAKSDILESRPGCVAKAGGLLRAGDTGLIRGRDTSQNTQALFSQCLDRVFIIGEFL
jgi:hypothetical protein